MAISVSLNGENYEQVIYYKEDAFEQLIAQNAQTIFGDKAIYIDAKHKISTSTLGDAIPDGFLIDISDIDDPQFYLVEVELQKHDFSNHILKQVTKFIASCNDSKHRHKLIDTLFSLPVVKQKVKNLIGSREIYEFLKDTLDSNQNILIIIDGPKPEFEETMKAYTEWGKMVKVQIVNHFKKSENNILTVEPPFQNLLFEDAISPSTDKDISEPSQYTEEFHLDGCEANIRDIYSKLKSEFLNIKSTLKFNPVKFYIGVRDNKNIGAIRFRKTKLLLEFDLSEDVVNLESKHHKIRLYASRGPMVEISDTSHWDEIQKLMAKLVGKHQET